MANTFEKLSFTKDWNNSADFPTYEENEAKVRADLQALHDETKNFINDKLIPGIENLAVPGSGDMLASIYDPNGKREDVFQYAEDKKAEAIDALRQHIDNQNNPHKVTADQVAVTENVVNAFEQTGSWSVDGILSQIGSTLFGKEVLYQWTKQRKELWKTGQTSITYEFPDSTKQYTILYYSNTITVDDNGRIALDSPQSVTVNGTSHLKPTGYFAESTTNLTTVYKTTDSTQKVNDTDIAFNYPITTLKNIEAWSIGVNSSIVVSEDPNAYTDGYVDDEGYTYTALDPITAFVPRIQTGSYTGTGTYGANNPCSLTFSFVPKFVLVMRSTSTTHVATSGTSLTWTGQPGASSGSECAIALSDKTLSWYGTSAAYQLNVSNNPYYWVAIG